MFGSRRSRRNSHPDWDKIHRLLNQVAIRQDRAEKRQELADKRAEKRQELADKRAEKRYERADKRDEERYQRANKRMDRLEELMDRTAREQKERDLAWFAKQEALQAKADKERKAEQRRRAKQEALQAKADKERKAEQRRRAKQEAQQAKKRAKQEAQRAKERAKQEAQQAKERAKQQAAWEARQAKERAKQEARQAKERAKQEVQQAKERAKQEAVWEARQAKEHAKQEVQQDKERAKQEAAWEARQDKERAKQQAAWEARQAKEREEYQRRMAKREEKQARDREEDERRMAKVEKEQARQQAVWAAQRASDLAELKEIAKRIQKDVGGITNTFGNIAEEYFLQAWENCDPVCIGPIKFTQVLAKQTYRGHGREMECDLVLLNGTHIAITEVKLSLDSRDVHTFHTKLKEVLPLVLPAAYRHLRVVPVMACTLMTKQARQSVVDHGFALLRPYGQQARLEIKHLRTWPSVNTVPGP